MHFNLCVFFFVVQLTLFNLMSRLQNKLDASTDTGVKGKHFHGDDSTDIIYIYTSLLT